MLETHKSLKAYPDKLRRVKYHDEELDKEFVFITKSFWGTTMNAVKTQVYCAIITYCLIVIIAYKLKVDRPIYEILQILNFSLLDKTPVRETLTDRDYKNIKELNYKQLKISWN